MVSKPNEEKEEVWAQSFREAIKDVGDGMNYEEAAARLRSIVVTQLLRLTDIVERPERFFMAHRLLAEHATRLGPGFWIRFTVHFNLFAGTCVALGTREQLEKLVKRNEERPRLGCFGLTEKLAGVNSGLVVETTAEFVDGGFVLNTPSPGACKNWISQGLVADEAVIVASLNIKGRSFGPQAFLVSMRDENGTLRSGITVEDMGRKTVGNDLDNGRLSFHKVKLPLDALLGRYLSVRPDGSVELPNGSLRTMDMIGQRLFSGRVAVAQASLQFAKSLFDMTRKFADNKQCWAPKGRPVLASVPQIRAILEKGERELSRLSTFMERIEEELCVCLREDTIPPLLLQRAIAVGKVKSVEGAIALSFALKQEVGSYALMAGTGFDQLDFLQCCKFAEGDSRILMQKMARDCVRLGPSKASDTEAPVLGHLMAELAKRMKAGDKKEAAWDACYKLVYALAESHMLSILKMYDAAPSRTISRI